MEVHRSSVEAVQRRLACCKLQVQCEPADLRDQICQHKMIVSVKENITNPPAPLSYFQYTHDPDAPLFTNPLVPLSYFHYTHFPDASLLNRRYYRGLYSTMANKSDPIINTSLSKPQESLKITAQPPGQESSASAQTSAAQTKKKFLFMLKRVRRFKTVKTRRKPVADNGAASKARRDLLKQLSE